MKSKKLFAILTLMAFMMTLLPMAAFAAADEANRYSSEVEVDVDTADADLDDEIEMTVYLFDDKGAAVEADTDVYVFSERGTMDKVYYENDKGDSVIADEVGSDVIAYTFKVKNGKADFTIKSGVVGTANIAVALGTELDDGKNLKGYWEDKDDVTASTIGLIASPKVTFVSASPEAMELAKVEGKGSNKVTLADGKIDGSKAYPIKYDDGYADANGIDYYEVTVRAYTNKTTKVPAKNEEIEFSCSDSDVRFSDETDETNGFGDASTKIYATKSGLYKITAECDDADDFDFYVQFGAPSLYNVEVASAPDPKIAKDDSKASVKLRLFDAQGQEIDVKDDPQAKDIFNGKANDDGDDVEVDVITAPKDKDEDDFDYTVTASDGLLKVEITDEKSTKGFKEEGTYEFKFSLESGKYITVKFDVVEQGDVVRLSLEYDQSNLPLEGKSSTPTVKRYDADDVSVEADYKHGDFTYSVNKLAILDKNQRDLNKEGYVEINSQNVKVRDKGQLIISDDDDYVGEELVVTVVDTKNDLTASYTFTIGNAVNGFEVTDGAAEVGKEAEVTVQLVDENGNKVAFGDDVTDVTFDYYVISKPAGAAVSCDEVSGFTSDLKEDGFSTVNIKSNKAGEVKVQFVIKADDVAYTGVATAKFGAAVDTTLGANAVTMFIGNTGYVQDGAVKTTDVAPFINPENNRTYVAVRPLGEAFGAEVDYDNTTKTATFTRPDMVVSITIGSNVITKVADGVTTTTEIDAPAFIKDGRTVLPFRAVGEAFGYKVNYDANTRAVSFTK